MKCPNCDSEMIWDNDFNSEDCGYDEKGIISYYEYLKCGTIAEIYVPEKSPNEEDDK